MPAAPPPAPPNGVTHVLLTTTAGPLTLELYYAHAPTTCLNFQLLASSGYYDSTVVHRVVPGFMLQLGDPTGTGRGGSSAVGAGGGPFQDEIGRALKHTGAGVLSMANAGPDTNKSQFFVSGSLGRGGGVGDVGDGGWGMGVRGEAGSF